MPVSEKGKKGIIDYNGGLYREGSVTIIGAVSPSGGDFSDPVVAATLNIISVFWALDKDLADRKHYPAINWTKSYTQNEKSIEEMFNKKYKHYEFSEYRQQFKKILQEKAELEETVQLVGRDNLERQQVRLLEVSKMITDDFLQQNSYSKEDGMGFCPMYKVTLHKIPHLTSPKTLGMMKTIYKFD